MKTGSDTLHEAVRNPLGAVRHLALAALAATALAVPAFAQTQPTPPVGPDFSKIEVKTTDLGKDTYMLEGAGGNVTVAIGKDAVVMVDGSFAPMHDKLKAAIEAKSKLPIKYLINTHHHGDHTGGNEAFAKDGVTIIAHPNVGMRLASGTTHNITRVTTPPRLDAVPKRTYEDTLALDLKGRVVQLRHAPAAHTDGDTYVWFADANVLSTGDTVTIGRYPNIDFSNGGNIRGVITASGKYLRLANKNTKIVPGHGPLATKEQLAEYRAMLVTSRDRMRKLIKENKSEQDVMAAKPFADLDAKWAANDQASQNWIKVVYNSLKK